MKGLKGYRTLIISIIIAALGVVEQSADVFGENSGIVLTIAGVLMFAMRRITDTPPGKGSA